MYSTSLYFGSSGLTCRKSVHVADTQSALVFSSNVRIVDSRGASQSNANIRLNNNAIFISIIISYQQHKEENMEYRVQSRVTCHCVKLIVSPTVMQIIHYTCTLWKSKPYSQQTKYVLLCSPLSSSSSSSSLSPWQPPHHHIMMFFQSYTDKT